jgi:hypothetical protein
MIILQLSPIPLQTPTENIFKPEKNKRTIKLKSRIYKENYSLLTRKSNKLNKSLPKLRKILEMPSWKILINISEALRPFGPLPIGRWS